MPINDFDRGLVEKFEAHDYEYSPANWNRLAAKLPESRTSRVKRYIWLPISGIAAALALLIGVPMMMNKSNNNDQVAKTQPAKAATPVATNATPVNIPATTNGTVTTNSAQPQLTTTSSSDNNTSTNTAQPVSHHHQVYQPVAHIPATNIRNKAGVDAQRPATNIPVPPVQDGVANNNVVPHSIPAVVKEEPAVARTEAPVPNTNVAGTKSTFEAPIVNLKNPSAAIAEGPKTETLPANVNMGIDPDDKAYAKNKRLSLSVAGAYNQGASNNGYMVGFNTRKNFGGKVFVEGDMAFASNRNNQQTIVLETTTFDTYLATAPQNLANITKAKSVNTASELYYLQVTPIVGYQLIKSLSIGAGADVQKMVQGKENTYFIPNGTEPKRMPSTDYGIVGKTEYTVYRSFKAGVQYRYGMNDVVAPDKNYINRNYLQIQLKIGLLGNK